MSKMLNLDPVVKAASRKEAFETLQAAEEQARHLDNETIQLTRREWQALYLYFAPKPPKKAKSPEQWVAKAVADKHEIRDYLKYLYSDGTRLIGCDGHRVHLHYFNGDQYPAGYYDPKTLAPVDKTERYPDIDRIMPGPGMLEPVKVFNLDNCELKEGGNRNKFQAQKLETDSTTQWFNRPYLEDAANGERHINMALAKEGGPRFAAQGDNEFGHFVIMPMRVDE